MVRQSAKINAQQTQAVHTYFRHKVTVVTGLLGTEKLTLIDVVLALENAFRAECAYVEKSEGVIFACTAGSGAVFACFDDCLHGLAADNGS